uniref:Uncharacterized protein n=1 Tax=Arundo donax TaxID=35708 RepID=A0A0A8YX77_ARUDO
MHLNAVSSLGYHAQDTASFSLIPC